MTSELFLDALVLHNRTFEKLLYPHPIAYNSKTQSISLNNFKSPKYIPFFLVYTLNALYFIASCSVGLLFWRNLAPLQVSLLGIFAAGLTWNMLFPTAVLMTKAGSSCLDAINALFREDTRNRSRHWKNKPNESGFKRGMNQESKKREYLEPESPKQYKTGNNIIYIVLSNFLYQIIFILLFLPNSFKI